MEQSFGYDTVLEHKETECFSHISDEINNCKWLLDIQKDFKVSLDRYIKDFQRLMETSTTPSPQCFPYGDTFVKDHLDSTYKAMDKFSSQFASRSIATLEDAVKTSTKGLATLKAGLEKAKKEQAKLQTDRAKMESVMTSLTQKSLGAELSAAMTKEKVKLDKKGDELSEQSEEISKRLLGIRRQLESVDWDILQSPIKATTAASEEFKTLSLTMHDIASDLEQTKQMNSAEKNLNEFLDKIVAAEKKRQHEKLA